MKQYGVGDKVYGHDGINGVITSTSVDDVVIGWRLVSGMELDITYPVTIFEGMVNHGVVLLGDGCGGSCGGCGDKKEDDKKDSCGTDTCCSTQRCVHCGSTYGFSYRGLADVCKSCGGVQP